MFFDLIYTKLLVLSAYIHLYILYFWNFILFLLFAIYQKFFALFLQIYIFCIYFKNKKLRKTLKYKRLFYSEK